LIKLESRVFHCMAGLEIAYIRLSIVKWDIVAREGRGIVRRLLPL